MDLDREGGGWTNWEISIDPDILPCVKQIVGRCYITQRAQLCDDLGWWDGGRWTWKGRQRGDICIHMINSLHCTTETNTTL